MTRELGDELNYFLWKEDPFYLDDFYFEVAENIRRGKPVVQQII